MTRAERGRPRSRVAQVTNVRARSPTPTRRSPQKSAKFYSERAKFLASQNRFADARDVLNQGAHEEAKPAATLKQARDHLDQLELLGHHAVHAPSGPDARHGLQPLPMGARRPEAHTTLGARPAAVVADAAPVHWRTGAAPTPSNAPLVIFNNEVVGGVGPRRPLDLVGATAVPPPVGDIVKENTERPTPWSEAVVPMVRTASCVRRECSRSPANATSNGSEGAGGGGRRGGNHGVTRSARGSAPTLSCQRRPRPRR